MRLIKSSKASAGQQGIWHSALCGSKIPTAFVVWALASPSECVSHCEEGFSEVLVLRDAPVLYFSGHIKRSKNANIPSVLWSHYHHVVKCEFISLSFQGWHSALTVNMIKMSAVEEIRECLMGSVC